MIPKQAPPRSARGAPETPRHCTNDSRGDKAAADRGGLRRRAPTGPWHRRVATMGKPQSSRVAAAFLSSDQSKRVPLRDPLAPTRLLLYQSAPAVTAAHLPQSQSAPADPCYVVRRRLMMKAPAPLTSAGEPAVTAGTAGGSPDGSPDDGPGADVTADVCESGAAELDISTLVGGTPDGTAGDPDAGAPADRGAGTPPPPMGRPLATAPPAEPGGAPLCPTPAPPAPATTGGGPGGPCGGGGIPYAPGWARGRGGPIGAPGCGPPGP